MGAPSSLFEVESFLKNMFNDPLILDIKSDFMRKMLASFITHRRVEEAKNNYKAIGGGSPLLSHTINLAKRLNATDTNRHYSFAMRYSAPFTDGVIEELQTQGYEDVVLFSLYPQYCSATTQSSILAAREAMQKLAYHPKLQIIESYPTHPLYIACIIEGIQSTLGADDPSEYILILSAHSLPQSRVDKGDPYKQQCEQSAYAIESALINKGLHFKQLVLAYQSKVGPMKWIGPSTQESIQKYKKHKIIVFPLSFTLDNSETDYELSILYAKLAQELNVPEYRVCRCFNDSQSFANAIVAMINELNLSLH